MAEPYPQALRDRVLAAYDRGMPTARIAHVFRVSPAWARRLKQRRRETGRTTPRPMGGATVVKVDTARLRELVSQHPDATVKELHTMLGADCGESAVDMALRRLKLTFKKRRSTPRSRTDPTSPSGGPTGSSGRARPTRGG